MLIYYFNGQKNNIASVEKISEKLLRRALADYAVRRGISFGEKDAERLTLVREEGEKPYFPDLPQVHFSVSHSFHFWACAMDDLPVGFDLEVPGLRWGEDAASRKEKLARRFFTAAENCYLENHPEAFFDLWVRKEAWLKLSGKGISGGLSSVDLVKDGRLLVFSNGVSFAGVDLDPEVRAACCSAKEIVIEEVVPLDFSEVADYE